MWLSGLQSQGTLTVLKLEHYDVFGWSAVSKDTDSFKHWRTMMWLGGLQSQRP